MRLLRLPSAVVYTALTVHTAYIVFFMVTFWRVHSQDVSICGPRPCHIYFAGAFIPLALLAYGAWRRWRVAEGLAVLLYAIATWNGLRSTFVVPGAVAWLSQVSFSEASLLLLSPLLLAFFALRLVQRRTPAPGVAN